MSLQDVIQKTLGAHGSWAWDDILDTECRIHCLGCGKALGALDEDVHSHIQSMQGDALQNAHQAEMVYEAIKRGDSPEYTQDYWRGYDDGERHEYDRQRELKRSLRGLWMREYEGRMQWP